LKKADVSWQVGFAKTPKHLQIGFEQGKQALGSILMHVTVRIFLLSMTDIIMHIALQRAIGARPAIPAEPSSPMITVLAALAFRKHRCENTPLT
jgi:hypothetical protein